MGYINPLLRLPAAQKLLQLPPEQRRALAAVLRELREESNAEAELSWRRRKGPMAAYWRAVSTYSGHFAHALSQATDQSATAPSGEGSSTPPATATDGTQPASAHLDKDTRTIDMFEANK